MGRDAFCCACARPLSPAHASASVDTQALTLRRVRLGSRALAAEQFDWKKISTLIYSLERHGPRWVPKSPPARQRLWIVHGKFAGICSHCLQVYVLCEDTTLNPPYFPSSFFYTAFGVFWIFLIWVLWMIVKCVRGLDTSLKGVNAILKEISDSLKNKI
jgi:hypothetical protein